MKKNIHKLELRRLFREFDFLLSDKEYKDEFRTEFNPEFHNALRAFIKKNPNLSSLASHLTALKNKSREQQSEPQEVQQKESENSTKELPGPVNMENSPLPMVCESENIRQHKKQHESSEKNPKVKKLYRLISKKTHPDKVHSKYMNDFYIQAKEAYDKNDISELMFICNELKIDFEPDKEDIVLLREKIKSLKGENLLFEQTYVWIWYHSDEKRRDEILQNFVLQQPEITNRIINSEND